ncbi:MAG: hypothetical protein M1829_004721 [Trizodia sp. TS-e1964]|nr:MAG: hypothetical protein M1829_004721 [Trizodia sp. TS-e1964]
MYSTLVRAQNVFGFFTTVAFVVCALIALTSFLTPQSPSASIDIRNVQVIKGRPQYYSQKKEEYAQIKFDLDADLSSLFTWNTKQVFVWVLATYPSTSPLEPASQAVIWDRIISGTPPPPPPLSKTGSKKKEVLPLGLLKLQNQRAKYQITDISGKLAQRGNATLELGWNVQPWVGALAWTTHARFGTWKALQGGRSKAFDFPSLVGKKTEAKNKA